MLNRIFHGLIEIVFWLAIWASPVLLFSAIGFVLFLYHPELYIYSWGLAGFGVVSGILIAEFVRRRYGCTRFMSRILSTPDIWPDED